MNVMNETVMVIQTAFFTRDYNYQVVYVLTACLQSIVHTLYLLKLIYICGHFLTVNKCCYGRCYMYIEKIYMYFPSLLHSWVYASRGKFSKIVSKCFLQVFNGFKVIPQK